MAIRDKNIDKFDDAARKYRDAFLDAPGGAAGVLQYALGYTDPTVLERVIVQPATAGGAGSTFDVEVETSAGSFAVAVNEMPADTTAGTVAQYHRTSTPALTELKVIAGGRVRLVAGASDPTAFIGRVTFVTNRKKAE